MHETFTPRLGVLSLLIGISFSAAAPAFASGFTAGDLVLSVYGNGDGSGSYGDNQASPIVLREITTTGSFVSQITLPQTSFYQNGVLNSAISGEYGSSSEGTLQLSADGHSLTIMGYGINAKAFDAATVNSSNAYGTQALAQTTSVQGGTYTAVSRVVASIQADGTVDTSTALYNIANTNNPRSVATVDGSSFYISGQGVKGDATQGLFYAQRGASFATAINTTTDTRSVSIYNGQLYVSTDSKQTGTTGTSKGSANIAVYGSSLPTTATTPTVLAGINNFITLASGQLNGINSVGKTYLSPESFFFANATTLYVADSGNPKEGGSGDGGLQKWVYSNGTWQLEYTLANGLNLVSNSASAGTTGLIGLTGEVVDGQVELFATNATIGDLDPTYLFGITDDLTATTAGSETFTTLVTAAAGTNIRGVAFAPTAAVPEPSSYALMGSGIAMISLIARRRRRLL